MTKPLDRKEQNNENTLSSSLPQDLRTCCSQCYVPLFGSARGKSASRSLGFDLNSTSQRGSSHPFPKLRASRLPRVTFSYLFSVPFPSAILCAFTDDRDYSCFGLSYKPKAQPLLDGCEQMNE